MHFSFNECLLLVVPFFAPLIIGAINGLVSCIRNK